MSYKPISAVILAAGSSKRMGGKKQLIRLDQEFLLEHVIKKCLKQPFQNIIVIIGDHAETIQQTIKFNDNRFKWIVNQDYEKGISSSLKTANHYLSGSGDSIMVFLGDMPFIKDKTISGVFNRGNDLLSHQDMNSFIITPTYNSKMGHPVFFSNSVRHHFN